MPFSPHRDTRANRTDNLHACTGSYSIKPGLNWSSIEKLGYRQIRSKVIINHQCLRELNTFFILKGFSCPWGESRTEKHWFDSTAAKTQWRFITCVWPCTIKNPESETELLNVTPLGSLFTRGVLQSIACLSTKSPSKYMSLYVWSISHFLYLIFNLRSAFLFLLFFSWFFPTFYIWLIFMSSAICYFFHAWFIVLFFLFMSCITFLCLIECLFFPSF